MQTNGGLRKTSASTAATKTGISFSVSVMDCIFSGVNKEKTYRHWRPLVNGRLSGLKLI
jgi:hypothetical protein